jgi:hypothetical protein
MPLSTTDVAVATVLVVAVVVVPLATSTAAAADQEFTPSVHIISRITIKGHRHAAWQTGS